MAGFERVEARTAHQGPLLRVEEVRFRPPDGPEFTREVVRLPGAVAVVPVRDTVDGPRVILIRQFRGAIEAELVEIPAGMRDVEGEPPEVTAQRELAEEVGVRAGTLVELTTFRAAAGFADHAVTVFLGRDLHDAPRTPHGPEEQAATVMEVPLAEAVADVRAGRITDAKTVIGLLLAAERIGGP